MGNAFLCKTDDPWAIFYNPAGLGTIRKSSLHLGKFHMELNKGFLNLTEGAAGDTLSKLVDNFSVDGLADNLRARPDNLSHARLNFFPSFATRYFSAGYFFSQQARAALMNSTADLEFAERRDHGPIVGLNFSIFGGVIKLGASAAYLNRREYQKDFAINDPVSIDDSDYKKGKALIVTTGTRITLPYQFLPTFAAVYRNSSSAEFKTESTAPDKIKSTLDLGVSITPHLGRASRAHLEINYKDLSDEYGVDSDRRLMAGIEFDAYRTYFVRFGYGDGYGSAGIGINGRSFSVDLTSYAINQSNQDFADREDRRFVFSFSAGL